MSAKKLRHLNRRRWLAQGVGLEGSSPTSPSRHLSDAGAPPGDAGNLVDPFLQAGLPSSTRHPPHRSNPMEAIVSVHPSQPQTFGGLFIFKCCLSWTQILILRGKSSFLTGTYYPSPTAPPLLSNIVVLSHHCGLAKFRVMSCHMPLSSQKGPAGVCHTAREKGSLSKTQNAIDHY